MSRRRAVASAAIDLHEEAEVIFPFLSYCCKELAEGLMSPWDAVGAFIIAYSAQRRPREWIASASADNSTNNESSSSSSSSRKVSSIPGLLNHIDANYLKRRLQKAIDAPAEYITIMQIFRCVRFTAAKSDAMRSIYHWSLGQRPYILLHRIPPPMEVLAMQARGERVITMLVSLKQLQEKHVSLFYYMSSDGDTKEHERDAFEFLLHDTEHMCNFCNEVSYYEQVGFFLQLSQIYGNGDIRSFFVHRCGYDRLFLKEMEYVISDMNCTLPHMLYYLMAKMSLASHRKFTSTAIAAKHANKIDDDSKNGGDNTGSKNNTGSDSDASESDFEANWTLLMQALGVGEDPCVSAVALQLVGVGKCRGKLTMEEGEVIRDFFKEKGRASALMRA